AAAPNNPRALFNPQSPVARNVARNQGNVGRPSPIRNQGFGQNANVGRNQGPASEMKGVQRPAENLPNRGPAANSNIRMPESRPMARTNVPRPPSAGGFSNDRGVNADRGMNNPGPRSNMSVPSARPENLGRPPASEM